MDPIVFKFVGIVFNVFGSFLFTIRAANILRALALVATAHEMNIQQLMPNYRGNIINFQDTNAHVERARGLFLLVLGIFLVVLGLIFQGVAAYLEFVAKST
jgi:hypothetical protein